MSYKSILLIFKKNNQRFFNKLKRKLKKKIVEINMNIDFEDNFKFSEIFKI
jgi:predicted sulfurtransferase